MGHGGDINCAGEPHPSSHKRKIIEKTNHGYTAVNAYSTSKMQAANGESYVQLEPLSVFLSFLEKKPK